MDDGPIWLIVLFAFCFLCSFYFNGTETAFSSVNRIRMRSHADNGDRRAKRVLYILDRFDKALTALLIGNNIANISCATIATLLATNYLGAVYVPYITLLTTLLVFLFAETLPKTFAKACNEWFSMAVSSSFLLIMRLLTPLVFIFSSISQILRKPFRRLHNEHPTVTEDELYDIIEDAVEDGALDEETGELVHSAILYTSKTVRDILTPWKDVLKLPIATPREQALAIIKQNGHSRLPVVSDTGEVLGLLHIRKYLKAAFLADAPLSLKQIIDPVHTVADTMAIDDLLPEMSNKKTHFTIVQDEWENVLGVVTMEDILEALVGEIYDEDDVEMPKAEGGQLNAR